MTKPWRTTLNELRTLQTELLRLAPYRDTGLFPNPGAKPEKIAAAEQRLGFQLPKAYREFLRLHDGWPRFFDGADLLGAEQLGNPDRELEARQVLRAALAPSATSPPVSERRMRRLLTFGMDQHKTTLFAFDISQTHKDGDVPVLAWIGEIGIRRTSFGELLQTLVEFCQAELEALTADGLRRAV